MVVMGKWTEELRLKRFIKYMIIFQKGGSKSKAQRKKWITFKVKFAIIREVFVENKELC